jgi:hypothetical protein
MTLDPARILAEGAKILAEVFISRGFTYSNLGVVTGSGGRSARGEFHKSSRRLELHFRYSLGLVTYHLQTDRDNSISHEDYMWSVIGTRFASEYPGFSDDPLDAFRALNRDIEQHGGDFVEGSEADFLRHIDRVAELKAQRGRLP